MGDNKPVCVTQVSTAGLSGGQRVVEKRESEREKINCAQIKTSLVGIGGRRGVERRRQTKRGRGRERGTEGRRERDRGGKEG